eukprot:gene19736-biopygen6277
MNVEKGAAGERNEPCYLLSNHFVEKMVGDTDGGRSVTLIVDHVRLQCDLRKHTFVPKMAMSREGGIVPKWGLRDRQLRFQLDSGRKHPPCGMS